MSRPRHRRAFTLLEVLIAIGLILLLLSAGFTFLANIGNARDRLDGFARRERAVTLLFDRLQRDLAATFVGAAAGGAGLFGQEQALTVQTRSVPARLAREGKAAFADIEQTTFRHRGATLEVTRTIPGFAVPATSSRLADDIWKVRFRYHDGTDWQTRFDAGAEDRLPLAIEVAVWFNDPAPEDEAALPDDGAPAGSDALDFDALDFDELDFDAPGFGDRPEDDELPPPDRVRIFAVPDAGAALGAAAEAFDR